MDFSTEPFQSVALVVQFEIAMERFLSEELNKQQALVDAVVAAAKQSKSATADAADAAWIVELAGRGLEAPESMSLAEIKTLCRSVIARAVADARL